MGISYYMKFYLFVRADVNVSHEFIMIALMGTIVKGHQLFQSYLLNENSYFRGLHVLSFDTKIM